MIFPLLTSGTFLLMIELGPEMKTMQGGMKMFMRGMGFAMVYAQGVP